MRIASLVLEFVTLISLTISLTCRSLLPHRLLANAFGVAQARASIHPLRPQAFANFASAWAHQGVAVFVENFERDVDRFDVMIRAHVAVGVGRCTTARALGFGDAPKGQ